MPLVLCKFYDVIILINLVTFTHLRQLSRPGIKFDAKCNRFLCITFYFSREGNLGAVHTWCPVTSAWVPTTGTKWSCAHTLCSLYATVCVFTPFPLFCCHFET